MEEANTKAIITITVTMNVPREILCVLFEAYCAISCLLRQESRVVVAKRCAVGGQPAGSSRAGEGSLPVGGACGRGRKKQLTVTMAGKRVS